MYAYGLTIAVWMHCVSDLPRIFIEAALAQSLPRRIVRFGPTVPVAPAAASVWQLLQVPTPVKIALPAAALLAAEEVLEVGALGELADEPGIPGCAAVGGGTPTGGGPLSFCDDSQVRKAAGVTTWTVAR